MNKTYANRVLRLLGKIALAYDIDEDRLDSDDRELLKYARAEADFYGVAALPIKVESGAIGESKGKTKRV